MFMKIIYLLKNKMIPSDNIVMLVLGTTKGVISWKK